MDLEAFRTQTRDAIDQSLNQLQTITLLIAQIEQQLVETGRSVQDLSHLVERFINEQQSDQSDETS